MKRSPLPGMRPGAVGPRRSTPPINYRRAPINYRRARVSELRGLSVAEVPLELLTYERTSSANMVRRARSHGHGSVRLWGVVMALCVTRAAGEWWLEVEAAAFDEVTDRRVPSDCSPAVLAALYRAVQDRQAGFAAHPVQQRAGRN